MTSYNNLNLRHKIIFDKIKCGILCGLKNNVRMTLVDGYEPLTYNGIYKVQPARRTFAPYILLDNRRRIISPRVDLLRMFGFFYNHIDYRTYNLARGASGDFYSEEATELYYVGVLVRKEFMGRL